MTDPTTTIIRYVGDDWTLPFKHIDSADKPVALITKTPIVFLTTPDQGQIYELNKENGGIELPDQTDPVTKGRFKVFVDRKVTINFGRDTAIPTGPYIGSLKQNTAHLRIVMEDAQGRRKTFTTLNVICKEA